MSKRRSDEARVLDYFTTAPAEKVELMFGLVRDVVRKRLAPTRSAGTAKRTRVGKATLGTGSSTEFDPAKIVSVS